MRKLAGAESLAGLIGLGLVALGVVGFVPGVVQEYGALTWWRGSAAELFGVFQTSILINLVHIGAGVLGLVAGSRGRAYLSLAGSAFFALGVYGLLADDAWNFMPFDRAADWLHIGLGVGLLYAGLAAGLAALRPAATT
jgi:hypothetical protein